MDLPGKSAMNITSLLLARPCVSSRICCNLTRQFESSVSKGMTQGTFSKGDHFAVNKSTRGSNILWWNRPFSENQKSTMMEISFRFFIFLFKLRRTQRANWITISGCFIHFLFSTQSYNWKILEETRTKNVRKAEQYEALWLRRNNKGESKSKLSQVWQVDEFAIIKQKKVLAYVYVLKLAGDQNTSRSVFLDTRLSWEMISVSCMVEIQVRVLLNQCTPT